MAIKYSVADKDVFIQILANYPVIVDKRTDAYNINKKKIAWAKIVVEYNAVANEKRTPIQLKRLWDKIKRTRKAKLAKEIRETMATGGGPSKPPPSSRPEIEKDADSDGILLNKKNEDASKEDETAGPSSASDVLIPVSGLNKTHLTSITEARLKLIKKEEIQMEELHKLRMEEANFKKEAARLVMFQEQIKLKKLQDS